MPLKNDDFVFKITDLRGRRMMLLETMQFTGPTWSLYLLHYKINVFQEEIGIPDTEIRIPQ